MNFLAHYLLATQYLPHPEPPPAYVVGNALPDLLPLASPQTRLRLVSLLNAPQDTPEEQAITQGVRVHLLTDASFHKTAAFGGAQACVGKVIAEAGFVGIRVRRFFLAHVLTELALDAVLLRRQPRLAADFYRDFTTGDYAPVVHWAETTLDRPLPGLTDVLKRFADVRYLESYATDGGVAGGLRRLSLRARQDAIDGANRDRLVGTVTEAIVILNEWADPLLSETSAEVTAASRR